MKKKPVKRAAKYRAGRQPTLKDLTISFETPEFPHHAKNELWYIGIGLLLLVGVIMAARLGNYLLSIVVIAAGLAIFRIAGVRPGSRKVEISPRGVQWGAKLFAYHQLKAFWASENSGQLTVYLERINLAPVIHFVVPDNKAESVLTFLLFELPFHEHRNEPVSDRFSRLLRI